MKESIYEHNATINHIHFIDTFLQNYKMQFATL